MNSGELRNPLKSPPHARFAFRIGVVGHRPNRLPKDEPGLTALRATIRFILKETKVVVLANASRAPEVNFYSPEPPILRAVSPLAEGSDRIFAEEALALGYELCCPMPFLQEEFENDFVPPAALEVNSLSRFRALLEAARSGTGFTMFELDGDRAHAEDAYGAAGRVVLNQSDLLIAVWDGGGAAGRGGTVQTLREAMRYHVPVIWIDARTPHVWRSLHDESDLDGERRLPDDDRSAGNERELALRDLLARIVQDELLMPDRAEPTRNPATVSHANEYFSEHKKPVHGWFVWKLFRELVGAGRFRFPTILVPDFEAQIQDEWPIGENSTAGNSDAETAFAPSVSEWINRKLRAHYAWADKLADLYADAYRGASILSYLFSALAVLAALLPMASGLGGFFVTGCIICELVILCAILTMLEWGRVRHWHDRWMEYRLLAELIRQLRFLIPLGGGKPLPRIPAHLAIYGDTTQTWMYWHMRAIARQIGIPNVQVTPAYVMDCLDFLACVVGDKDTGQWGFHVLSACRSRHISSRLRAISFALFVLTIVCVGAHLFLRFVPGEQVFAAFDRLLILFSAFLPALGAAVAGINNQGEFTRIAKRSAAMASGFEKFAARIHQLRESDRSGYPPPKLSEAISLSSKIAETMVEEVVDWRTVFIDRPQSTT